MQGIYTTVISNGHRVITPRVSFSLKLEFFADLLWLSALHVCLYTVKVGLRRRGGNISADLFLYVLLYIKTS